MHQLSPSSIKANPLISEAQKHKSTCRKAVKRPHIMICIRLLGISYLQKACHSFSCFYAAACGHVASFWVGFKQAACAYLSALVRTAPLYRKRTFLRRSMLQRSTSRIQEALDRASTAAPTSEQPPDVSRPDTIQEE